jgi:hypothetical protein
LERNAYPTRCRTASKTITNIVQSNLGVAAAVSGGREAVFKTAAEDNGSYNALVLFSTWRRRESCPIPPSIWSI